MHNLLHLFSFAQDRLDILEIDQLSAGQVRYRSKKPKAVTNNRPLKNLTQNVNGASSWDGGGHTHQTHLSKVLSGNLGAPTGNLRCLYPVKVLDLSRIL